MGHWAALGRWVDAAPAPSTIPRWASSALVLGPLGSGGLILTNGFPVPVGQGCQIRHSPWTLHSEPAPQPLLHLRGPFAKSLTLTSVTLFCLGVFSISHPSLHRALAVSHPASPPAFLKLPLTRPGFLNKRCLQCVVFIGFPGWGPGSFRNVFLAPLAGALSPEIATRGGEENIALKTPSKQKVPVSLRFGDKGLFPFLAAF